MDMSEIAQRLPKQSMPDVYLVILEYEKTQEAESISRPTIIVGGGLGIHDTNMLYFVRFLKLSIHVLMCVGFPLLSMTN